MVLAYARQGYGTYLSISLVSLKGSLRRKFLCMFMIIMISDMDMMNFHIVDTQSSAARRLEEEMYYLLVLELCFPHRKTS